MVRLSGTGCRSFTTEFAWSFEEEASLPIYPLGALQANGFSALHWAVVRGNADTTIDLVDAGAAVNIGYEGCTLFSNLRLFCLFFFI